MRTSFAPGGYVSFAVTKYDTVSPLTRLSMSADQSHDSIAQAFLSPSGCRAIVSVVTVPSSEVTVTYAVGPTPGTGLTSRPVSYTPLSDSVTVMVLSRA